MKLLLVPAALCALLVPGFALDRQAFTFSSYHLDVRIEPQQRRLAVRGKVTLRNDSASPQKNLCLQISSSLAWRSIAAGGKPVQFVSQTYTSDIDHTGALSEAIVSLPREVAPKTTVELEIGYEGVIAQDVTRLTRIGVPEETARHTDWDQIGNTFTAVRGLGYVAWYPVAMESANLSEGSRMLETLGRWKARHAETTMSVLFGVSSGETVWFSGTPETPTMINLDPADTTRHFPFAMQFGQNVPSFAIANYQNLPVGNGLSTVSYLPGHEGAAKAHADAIARLDPPIAQLGRGPGRLQVLELSDPEAAPFVTEDLLFTPLGIVTAQAELGLVYALARQYVSSPAAWIEEGLARYAQARQVARRDGRQAALDYLSMHRDLLVEAEKEAMAPNGGDAPAGLRSAPTSSLLSAADDLSFQTKAMWVWWMLRDMVGEQALTGALLGYRAAEDREPAYMERLIEAQAHRDLGSFFDDWVYHDRGLPDFRVASVYPLETPQGNYMVTVTVENLGSAGAEVPVTVRSQGGEATTRLAVAGRSRNAIRIEVPAPPQEIVVNDGSVPESDTHNNRFKVQPASDHR